MFQSSRKTRKFGKKWNFSKSKTLVCLSEGGKTLPSCPHCFFPPMLRWSRKEGENNFKSGKHENTRSLRWETENHTVLSYYVTYIGGFLTVRKTASRRRICELCKWFQKNLFSPKRYLSGWVNVYRVWVHVRGWAGVGACSAEGG